MNKTLEKKYLHLRKIISQAGSVAVAFSGGVDSTFLLKVCTDLLEDNVLAVTARSETFPHRELRETINLAAQIGAKHVIINTKEMELPGFSDNPPYRCYLCKTELFSKLKAVSEQHGIQCLFEGSNADDLKDFRPGRAAAKKMGVRSPLEEAGLAKNEIRELSAMLDLITWNKPSLACLSSRFPYHSKITREALRQVEQAEDFLWEIGMRVFRVRHHDTVARIELGEAETATLWEQGLGPKISRHLKTLGYKYVTLDLKGYRSGSMNEMIEKDKSSMRDPND